MLSVEADDSALTVSDDGTDKAETSTSQHSSSASSSHIQVPYVMKLYFFNFYHL